MLQQINSSTILIDSQRRRHRDVDKIRTGNRFVDSHSLKSTLGEDIGGEVDRFREARLKDYYKLCKLCKDQEIELTPNLLERGRYLLLDEYFYTNNKTYFSIPH